MSLKEWGTSLVSLVKTKVTAVESGLSSYKTSNNSAVAGVKATADANATSIASIKAQIDELTATTVADLWSKA